MSFTVPRYATTGGSGEISRRKTMLTKMATASILPSKFDGDDIVVWLREFDACALANGWKDEDKIKKLPAFLRGRAATHFYATPAEERAIPTMPQQKTLSKPYAHQSKGKTTTQNLITECCALVKTRRFINGSWNNF